MDRSRTVPDASSSLRRLGALLGVVALVAAACGSAASPAPSTGATTGSTPAPSATPSGPLVLKVATTAGITTWDPIKSFSTEALYLANIYEPLLWVNPPGSAEEFTPGPRDRMVNQCRRPDVDLQAARGRHVPRRRAASRPTPSSNRSKQPRITPAPRSSGCHSTRSMRPTPRP